MSKWITSDTHYGHKNICRGVSEWKDLDSTRKFKTLEEMNQTIVDNINSCVKEDDELYFLGDWAFGGIKNILIFWEQLNCKNIFFIPGNHDHHIKKKHIIPDTDISVDKLFTVLPELYTIVVDGVKVILCHYPLEDWEDRGLGSIHLHGHSHHSLDSSETTLSERRFDVGMDWYEFRPFNLTGLIKNLNEENY